MPHKDKATRLAYLKAWRESNREKRLAVDHDHATSKIRGLLCSVCNIGIGKLGDSIAGLQRSLDYLTNPPPLAAILEPLAHTEVS
jgi:hypothetical protein